MSFEAVWEWLKRLFVHNFWWKAFSVASACFVYFLIRSGISDVSTLTIPVEIDAEAQDLNAKYGAVIASFDPPSVQVKVRGAFSDVSQAQQSSIRCILRPRWKKNAIEDSMTMDITRSNFRGLPRALNILKIEPDAAVVAFDLPMSIPLAITPPVLEGKARGRVELSFSQTNAVVRGSQRILRGLDKDKLQIRTDPINVEGRSLSFTTPVKLLPPGDVPNATIEPQTIDVSVKIVAETATRHLEHGKVFISKPFASLAKWKVDPEWVEYDVKGRAEVIDNITDGQIVFSVDGLPPTGSETTTNEVPVRAHILQGLSVDDVSFTPQTVKLIVEPIQPTPAQTEE